MTDQAHYVEKAVDMMRADLGAELLVADLAAAVHVSRYHFARMFAAVTGVPPHRYLYRLRMAEACRLLATTDLRVLDVAVAVGYGNSVGTFASRFRAYAGYTPAAYRKNNFERAESVAPQRIRHVEVHGQNVHRWDDENGRECGSRPSALPRSDLTGRGAVHDDGT